MSNKIIPVILCGGSGTRLWPFSRENLPKQFLKLINDASLLQETVMRAQRVSGAEDSDFVIVTLENSQKEVARQLSELDPMLASHIIGEPSARDTAAAVALAAHYIARNFGSDAIMWVLPADHHIGDEKSLRKALNKAVETAKEDYLTTFGIVPSHPETGYGYIRFGDTEIAEGVKAVSSFVEKPNFETAKAYLESGEYLWNSGMFVFKTAAVLENYMQHAHDISRQVQQAIKNNTKRPDADLYAEIQKTPFDKAIMERSGKVAVIPCEMNWSDVGSWGSLWDISDKDPNGNVIDGPAVTYNSRNCIIKAQDRLVACAGLENIVVAETADAILIADKNNSDDLKVLVNAMKKEQRRELREPTIEHRPWGLFRILSCKDSYKVKELVLEPGSMQSLQMHHHRSEFLVVIEGEAHVMLDSQDNYLGPQDMIYIPRRTVHRLSNPGKTPLRLIEIESGDYLAEDDIVRYEDIYGRAVA